MPTLQELCSQLSALKQAIVLENAEREERKAMGDYQALSKRIEEAMLEQDRMLTLIPDSRAAYDALHAQVLDMMEEQKVYAVGDVRGKFRESKEVNANKVLKAIGGDWDLYLTLSNVTQTALKAFAAENPELKKELNDCIEVTDRKLVDLAFEAPISPL